MFMIGKGGFLERSFGVVWAELIEWISDLEMKVIVFLLGRASKVRFFRLVIVLYAMMLSDVVPERKTS